MGSFGSVLSSVVTLLSIDFESKARKKASAVASALFGASFAGTLGFIIGYLREKSRINELRISIEKKKKTPKEIQDLAVQLFTVIVNNYLSNKGINAKKCNLFVSGIPLYINLHDAENNRVGIAYCEGQKMRVKDFISHYCDLFAANLHSIFETEIGRDTRANCGTVQQILLSRIDHASRK